MCVVGVLSATHGTPWVLVLSTAPWNVSAEVLSAVRLAVASNPSDGGAVRECKSCMIMSVAHAACQHVRHALKLQHLGGLADFRV